MLAIIAFLSIGFKHFKDKSKTLKKDLDIEKIKVTKNKSQIETYIRSEEEANESIKKAEAEAIISTKRDYFE